MGDGCGGEEPSTLAPAIGRPGSTAASHHGHGSGVATSGLSLDRSGPHLLNAGGVGAGRQRFSPGGEVSTFASAIGTPGQSAGKRRICRKWREVAPTKMVEEAHTPGRSRPSGWPDSAFGSWRPGHAAGYEAVDRSADPRKPRVKNPPTPASQVAPNGVPRSCGRDGIRCSWRINLWACVKSSQGC